MHRTLKITGIIAASLTAFAVAATPVLAAGGPPPNTTTTCTGTCTGTGTGTGQTGYGRGNGGGMTSHTAVGSAALPSGTLTAAQRTALASMAQEEKMAHDVYVALAAKFPTIRQFSRIANAESSHLTALRTLMTRYGITDPTAGVPAGQFSIPAFQTLYNNLVAGATTTTAALAAGVTVEKTDIASLDETMVGVTAPDVLQVYTNLRSGSEKHLVAFGG